MPVDGYYSSIVNKCVFRVHLKPTTELFNTLELRRFFHMVGPLTIMQNCPATACVLESLQCLPHRHPQQSAELRLAYRQHGCHGCVHTSAEIGTLLCYCWHIVGRLSRKVHIFASPFIRRRRRFWHATHDCVAPYVDIILHRGRF